ncbi:MAG: hypothetical protein IPM95_14415 [Sphingobacteriales bacterium]|nr:hypothetical protein [Sphingobacteriales bacterium]
MEHCTAPHQNNGTATFSNKDLDFPCGLVVGGVLVLPDEVTSFEEDQARLDRR